MPPGIGVRRPRNEEEIGFIVKSWLRSYKDSDWAGSILDKHRDAAIKQTILSILNRAEVRVAYLEDDPDFLFGFVCYETGHPWPLVHYVYVKGGKDNDYRKRGIGTALVETAKEGHVAQARFTFRTKLGSYLFPRSKHYRPQYARSPKAKVPAGD